MSQLKMISSATEGQGTHSLSTIFTYGAHICFNVRELEIQNRFIGHLNHALREKGIKTTVGDHEFTWENEILETKLTAIEQSRCSIPVFCPKFPFSTECLEELVKINDCRKIKGQLVQPIFYYTDPSEVRNRKGSYGRAMAEHLENFKDDKIKVYRWEVALNEIANLCGLHLQNGCESTHIQKFVEEMSKELNKTSGDSVIGLVPHCTVSQSLSDPGSCDDVDRVEKNAIGGLGTKHKMLLDSSYVAGLENLLTYSHQKESDRNIMPSTFIASTSQGRGEILGLKVSGAPQPSSHLNFRHSEDNGMNKRRLILTGAEITHSQCLDRRYKEVSIISGVEDGLISREQKRNISEIALNAAHMDTYFASVEGSGAFQGTGHVSLKTREETEDALQILQQFISNRSFSELMVPEGLESMESILRPVLSFSADGKFSTRLRSVVEILHRRFTGYSKDYKEAEAKLKETTDYFSRTAELKEQFVSVLNAVKKVYSDEKYKRIWLEELNSEKVKIEDALKNVNAEITDVLLSLEEVDVEKKSLMEKGTEVKTEKDNMSIQWPRISAEQKCAKTTQENIEAAWSQFIQQVFNETVMSEMGSG